MKTISQILVAIIICFLAACGKKENDTPAPISYTLTLDSPMVVGDKVVLKWSGLDSKYVKNLTLERAYDTMNYNNIPKISLPIDAKEYSDTFMLTPYVKYKLTAQVSDGTSSKIVTSNARYFSRADIDFLPWVPRDAICDKTSGIIYLIGPVGELAMYNVAGRSITKLITTGGLAGQCILATHNGRKELYVPRNDGWLFIYDAATLEQVDQVNVGPGISSVVYNDGKLFMSTSTYASSIVSYDRTSKARIDDTNYFSTGLSLKQLPGSNTEVIGVNGSNGLLRFTFNANGKLDTIRSVYVSGSYFYSSVFEFLPSGDRFVTASDGTIYNADLVYVSALPRGTRYLRSFDVDAAGGQIYCSTDTREVHVYSTSTYLQTRKQNTVGYPLKTFYCNGVVVCVSTAYSISGSSASNPAFIERWTL